MAKGRAGPSLGTCQQLPLGFFEPHLPISTSSYSHFPLSWDLPALGPSLPCFGEPSWCGEQSWLV